MKIEKYSKCLAAHRLFNDTTSDSCRTHINSLSWDLKSDDGTWQFLLIYACSFVVYFGLLLVIESDWFTYTRYLMRDTCLARLRGLMYDTQGLNCVNRGDLDVAYEQYRIDEMRHAGILTSRRRASGPTTDDMLVLHRLGKHYRLSFMAVKGISVGLKRGECLGILGVNGAGKSCVFRMLTGMLNFIIAFFVNEGESVTIKH